MRVLTGLLLSGWVIALTGCTQDAPERPVPEPAKQEEKTLPASTANARVEVSQLKQDLDAGKVPVLVDVRTPAEYDAGHVPGAKNIPLDTLETRLAELESYRAQPVYVICESGRRSASAATLLAEKGFQIRDVAGGTKAWRTAGYGVDAAHP